MIYIISCIDDTTLNFLENFIRCIDKCLKEEKWSLCGRILSLWQTSSTLADVLADVSMKTKPCSRANASPSSFCTSRRADKSLKSNTKICVYSSTNKNSRSNHLFPMSIITILDVACCRASSSQVVRWLNVWRLFTSMKDRCSNFGLSYCVMS